METRKNLMNTHCERVCNVGSHLQLDNILSTDHSYSGSWEMQGIVRIVAELSSVCENATSGKAPYLAV